MLMGYDIETTGIDLWHGCCPFAYSAVLDDGTVHYDEWDVDPYTRQVDIPVSGVEKLGNILNENSMVCHNAEFDMLGSEIALNHPEYQYEHTWDWSGIEDSLVGSHVLRNLWPHDLKTLRAVLLMQGNVRVDLLYKAVEHARRICRSKKFKDKHGEWRIAKEDDPHWPALKSRPTSGWWVFDMWLPSTICRLAPEFLPPENQYAALLDSDDYHGYFLHPWENLCQEYCIEDSMSCLVVWQVIRDALEREGLYDQYLERKELLRVCYKTMKEGVTLRNVIVDERKRYRDEASRHRIIAEDTMKKHGYKEPNINSSQQLQAFIYTDMMMPVRKKTATGQPSTDADTLETLRDDNQHHWGSEFLDHVLLSKRNGKADEYLTSYMKWSTQDGRIEDLYWCGTSGRTHGGTRQKSTVDEYRSKSTSTEDRHFLSRRIGSRLHTNFNITGTRFTRQSTSKPNLQNVGTGKEEGGEIDYQLRYSFGPRKGRYWLAIDYANIELRIWAYLCGNKEFIRAFEENQSIHLLIAKELHPGLRKFDTTDEIPKELYHLYKRTKNGNFAIIYGATPITADKTYKVSGAYRKISSRFPEVRTFTTKLHNEVRARGYIETLTGYRLYIPREDPHKAVSGKIQGTAGNAIGRAMVRCENYLEQARVDGSLILQIHDELVFDFPNEVELVDPDNERNGLVFNLEREMESVGEEISIPLAVDSQLISEAWSEGVAL